MTDTPETTDNPIWQRRLDAGCAVLSDEIAEAYEPKWRDLLARIYDAMDRVKKV